MVGPGSGTDASECLLLHLWDGSGSSPITAALACAPSRSTVRLRPSAPCSWSALPSIRAHANWPAGIERWLRGGWRIGGCRQAVPPPRTISDARSADRQLVRASRHRRFARPTCRAQRGQCRACAPRWVRVGVEEKRRFRVNAYRVLLTRARAGLVIHVPRGAAEDATRDPTEFDAIAATLTRAGAAMLHCATP